MFFVWRLYIHFISLLPLRAMTLRNSPKALSVHFRSPTQHVASGHLEHFSKSSTCQLMSTLPTLNPILSILPSKVLKKSRWTRLSLMVKNSFPLTWKSSNRSSWRKEIIICIVDEKILRKRFPLSKFATRREMWVNDKTRIGHKWRRTFWSLQLI